MSQILDAINKADKERKEQTKPKNAADLYQQLQGNQAAGRGPWIGRLSVLLAIVLCGLAYAAYRQQWFSNAKPQTTEIATPPLPNVKKVAEIDGKQAVPNPITADDSQKNPPAEKVAKETAIKSEVTNTSPANPAARTHDEEIPPKKTVEKPAGSKADTNKLVKLTAIAKKQPLSQLKPLTPIKQKPKPQAKPQKTRQNVSRETSVRPTLIKASSGRVNSHKATPSWKKNIHIAAIVYDNNPKKRFVLVDGKKVYEGGTLPNSETEVVKILPQQIIINDGSGDVLIR